MTGVLRADALRLPLRNESVDLCVTSPPYYALRSYRDAGEHYSGQIGSEPTPQAFLESLWTVMHEVWRVLKPTGSCFVNLGGKRSGSGGGNQDGLKSGYQGGGLNSFQSPRRYNQAAFGRVKSKMLLPHRFAIGCEDGLADPEGKGWIVRQDICWQKVNGLPESCTDRTRDAHEFIFHLTKEGRYFSAMDEVREKQSGSHNGSRSGVNGPWHERIVANGDRGGVVGSTNPAMFNPLGKLPGSVWPIASEPLRVPDHLAQHFAAFPTALPLRCIKGWSPAAICTACGEGRRPVVDSRKVSSRPGFKVRDQRMPGRHASGNQGREGRAGDYEATITGYACSCPSPDAPTCPSVVLDIFGGTGTTAAVARALGRIGVSVDLSMDYARLARWRIFESGDGERAVFGARPPRQIEGQADLFGGAA